MINNNSLVSLLQTEHPEWRDWTPQQRMACVEALVGAARSITWAGIVHQHPAWTTAQIRIELVRRLLPLDLWRHWQAQENHGATNMLDITQHMFEHALHDMLAVFEYSQIPFVIVGGFASSLWGEPRITRDADVLVQVTTPQLQKLAAAAQPNFYHDPLEALYESVRQHQMFNLVHHATGIKIDCYPQAHTPNVVEQFQQRRQVRYAGMDLPVASPEWVILSKLQWYQQAVSEKQWQDVRGILLAQEHQLNWPYLAAWAERLRIHTLLAQAKAGISADAAPETPLPDPQQRSLFDGE